MNTPQFGIPCPEPHRFVICYEDQDPHKLGVFSLLRRMYSEEEGYSLPQNINGWQVLWPIGVHMRRSAYGRIYTACTEEGELWLRMNAPDGYTDCTPGPS